MNKMVISVTLVFLSCSQIPFLKKDIQKEQYNYQYSTGLADQQNRVLNDLSAGKKISKTVLDSLENNMWVLAASKMAPGNLVVRQWALIDIIKGKAKNKDRIVEMFDCLSSKNPGSRIWLEGYSYFVYTMEVMYMWQEKFLNPEIDQMIKDIEDGFVKTAYLREDVWYPAPFGDLRNEPLSPHLNERCQMVKSMTTSGNSSIIDLEVLDSQIIYYIDASPMGLNFHVPKDNKRIEIINGKPVGFVFYSGYPNKYLSRGDELKDLFDEKRVKTIGACNAR